MSHIELYQLIDADDLPATDFLYESYEDAKKDARALALAVEALIYEYTDSETLDDYREEGPK